MKKKLTTEQLRSLQSEKHYRLYQVREDTIDEENRTVRVAFSSEDPYERYWGIEVLGHGEGEVVMDFLKSDGAPALAQHNHGQQIGVISEARIDKDGKGRCTIRFGKGPLAEEYFQDVVDGIRKNISVGYMIHNLKLVEENEDIDTYRVTKWEPFEVSFVSVPADKTVGVGRSAEEQLNENTNRNTKKGGTMPKPKEEGKTVEVPEVDVKKIETDTRQAELERIREIDAIGKEFNLGEKATEFINDGKSVDQMRAYALDHLKKNGMKPVETLDPNIGLNEKETKQFSFLRAIRALANPENRNAQEAAKFEFEVSEAVAAKLKKDARGIMVPMEVLSRDQQVTDPSLGGHLVATSLLTGSFIDMLQNLMLLQRMGVTNLTGLVGDIAIPKLLTGYAAYWVDEGNDPAESSATFGQVALTPKTVGARTELSRKFLLQSSLSAEGFARMQLALTLALELDRVGIAGSGTSPEPRGILNTSGIGAVVCGDPDGAAMTWAHVVELWSSVATENAAVGSTGFLTNSKVIGQLMTTEKAAGTAQFVVKDFPDASGFTGLAGSRCGVSNQVPSNLTKGSGTGLSAAIFGNFSDLIMGMWGTLDLTIDPYTKAESGAVRVIALQDVDVAVKRAQSFSAAQDIATA